MTRDHRWVVESPEAMIALGRAFGEGARGGEVFRLTGALGAGKTQWVKGLGEGLGITGVINSPSYVIEKSHAGRLTLHHIDLYRLTSVEACRELALEERVEPETVVAVEWAERFPAFQRDSAVHLALDFGERENERVARLTAWASHHDDLVRRVTTP